MSRTWKSWLTASDAAKPSFYPSKTIKVFSMLRTICLKNLFAIMFVLVSSLAGTTALKTPPPAAPRVFILDARQLQATKQRIQSGDKTLDPALSRLARDEQKPPSSAPFSSFPKY